MEHVIIPEPSRVQVPLCYFAFRGTEFVGSCKMCNLLFFKPFVMERILSSKLSFFFFAEVLVVYEIPEFFL